MNDEIPNAVPDDDPLLITRIVARTTLLAISIVLLFPAVLGGVTHGAWPRLMLELGLWRWVAWGACFLAMVVLRFAGGPRRQ